MSAKRGTEATVDRAEVCRVVVPVAAAQGGARWKRAVPTFRRDRLRARDRSVDALYESTSRGSGSRVAHRQRHPHSPCQGNVADLWPGLREQSSIRIHHNLPGTVGAGCEQFRSAFLPAEY